MTRSEEATDQPQTSSFDELGGDAELVKVLAAEGIDTPFAIQRLAIPDALAGRDVCGQAKTGSGKTLVFGLTMIQQVAAAKPKRPTGLILVPTRELANQVTDVMTPLAAAAGKWILAVYGGTSMRTQINALKDGVDIVIATPGRLIDLLDRKHLSVTDVTMVAIDEADQMADMGFLPQVHTIMRRIEGEHQTLLFSATLDGQVGALIRSYMNDPVRHEVASAKITVDTMEHRFLKVHQMDKVKVAALITESVDRTLVFVQTKIGADRVTDKLQREGVKAAAIHGGLHQSRRERTLRDFADGKLPVLVATNVAARGLDVEGVDIVMHYDPPDDPKTYLHRSGRTARAGDTGLVVTLVEWDQVNEVLRIQKQAGLREPIVKMFSNDERLRHLDVWEPDVDEGLAPPDQDAVVSRRRSRGGPRRRRRR